VASPVFQSLIENTLLNGMLNRLIVPLLIILASACGSGLIGQQGPAACTVSRVSDGDTFRCRDGRRVRLTGIDGPELEQQPFGLASRAALLRLLPPGITVRLETDVAPLDQYGRVLAYAWSGDTLINEVMLRNGWAVLYTVPPNIKYVERLARAQKEARANHAGLWSEGGFDCPPSQFRRNHCLSRP
jgi:micrococcal nuclease